MDRNPSDTRDMEQCEGRYANYFQVGYNAFECILDFGQYYPETVPARWHTRIITTPSYLKTLSKLLGEAMAEYEAAFGPIPDSDDVE